MEENKEEQKDLLNTNSLRRSLEEDVAELESDAAAGHTLEQTTKEGKTEGTQEVLNRARGIQADPEKQEPLKPVETINPEVAPPKPEPNAFQRSVLATTPLAIPTAVGLGVIDFGIDVATKITGQEKLDDRWDHITKFHNPWAQRLRNFAGIAIPTFIPATMWGRFVTAAKLPALTNALAHIGGGALISTSVIGFSDQGEEHNLQRTLADTFPTAFGPQGALPIPEDWKTQDGDSPAVRRQKNMIEETVLSGAADILGFAITGAKPVMHWFKPKSPEAKAYKAAMEMKHSDKLTIKEIARLRHVKAVTKGLKKQQKKLIDLRIEKLTKQMRETGYSEATGVPAEAYVQKQTADRTKQIDEVAMAKLQSQQLPPKVPGQPRDYDPWITPKLANKAENAVNTMPVAPEARNAAEVAAIKQDGVIGDAPPLLTAAMQKKLIGLDASAREVIGQLTDNFRKVGNYDAIVNTIRKSRAMMDDAAWQIYADIIRPGTGADLRKLFVEWDEFDIKRFTGKKEVQYLNEEQSLAAALAIRDLTRLYLGKETVETSARLMDTVGREIASNSAASIAYKELIDDDRVKEMVLDKLQFLTTEYGLSKYIAGWSLRNKRWWQVWKDPEPFKATIDELDNVRKTRNENFIKFRQNLDELAKEEPLIMRPLLEAFVYTDGDVIALDKLTQFAKDAVSPTGLLKSADPNRLNLFAKGAWGVVYNNTLSGLSGLRAAVGNGTKIMLKPIESVIGHGIEAIRTGSMEPVRKAMYYHAATLETTRRALGDAVKRMKMVHNDPDFMMKAIREDFKVADDDAWRILDDLNEVWKKNGDTGMQFQYGWAKANRDISKMRWMRIGTTFMSGVDAATDTFMATNLSRFKAYQEVIESKGGFSTVGDTLAEELARAERRHYDAVFDKNGMLTDEYAKHASGEIALNLDDGVAKFVNQATTAVPAMKTFFMFPRTGMNMVKMASSYTPLTLIPGLNKYSAVLSAGDDIDLIKKAMGMHGIKEWDKVPNAMAMYRNLVNEYRGRIALGAMTAISFYGWAAAGNLRGNGPTNNSERVKLRAMGWRQKTINIGGKWVSYDGLPMIDTIFTLIGDLAYYQNDLGSELTQDFMDKIAWTLSATFINNTPLYGLEPMQAAMNGDQSAFNRIVANVARGAIPMSGALGVVSNAITNSQKDIYNDLMGYITNRVPIASSMLPERIDMWTGKPINEIDNPLLRTLNALSPVKVSQGDEPWRKWLFDINFDSVGLLTRTSNGRKRYSHKEREMISKFIGEEQLWKVVEEMRNNPIFIKDMQELAALRRQGYNSREIEIKKQMTYTHRYLTSKFNAAKRRAEQRLLREQPHLLVGIQGQQHVDSLVKNRQVGKAGVYSKKYEKEMNEKKKLVNHWKNP